MKTLIIILLVANTLINGQFAENRRLTTPANLIASGGEILRDKNQIIVITLGQTNYTELRNSTYLLKTGFLKAYNNVITDVKDYDLPKSFQLYQNYPNPFNPTTTIKYEIPEKVKVHLAVYDILGREIKVLVNEIQNAGKYKINFNGGALASGVYIYRLTTEKFIKIKKMLLIK